MTKRKNLLIVFLLLSIVILIGKSNAAIDVEVVLNNRGYESHDHFKASLYLNNHEEESREAQIFAILDVDGIYYFWPNFGLEVSYQNETIAMGVSQQTLLEFNFSDIDDIIPYGPLRFWGGWYMPENRYGIDVAEFWLGNEHKWTPTPYATETPESTFTPTGPTFTATAMPTATCTPKPAPREFVYVPAGSFQMGSPDEELCRDSDEGPVHIVTLTDGFYMQTTEVTQGQWAELFGKNPSYHKNCENCPVERVTWFDCCIYCNRLSQAEGLTPCYYKDASYQTVYNGTPPVKYGHPLYWKRDANGYRLPTEAEWEYACRAGTVTAYNNGRENTSCIEDSQLDPLAWYSFNSDTGKGKETHPVELKQANRWGFYDMHGNVYEWCWDKYDPNYYETSPATNPIGSSFGWLRVMRGGCWADGAWSCRSAERFCGGDPGDRRSLLGFRILKSVD